MNDRIDEQGRQFARGLNASLSDMDQYTLERLRKARESALAKQRVQSAWAFAVSGNGAARIGVLRYFSPRYILPIAALIFVVTGMIYWQNIEHIDEVADIDAKLLSGELPIDAYLDKGLDSWLKRTSY